MPSPGAAALAGAPRILMTSCFVMPMERRAMSRGPGAARLVAAARRHARMMAAGFMGAVCVVMSGTRRERRGWNWIRLVCGMGVARDFFSDKLFKNLFVESAILCQEPAKNPIDNHHYSDCDK